MHSILGVIIGRDTYRLSVTMEGWSNIDLDDPPVLVEIIEVFSIIQNKDFLKLLLTYAS